MPRGRRGDEDVVRVGDEGDADGQLEAAEDAGEGDGEERRGKRAALDDAAGGDERTPGGGRVDDVRRGAVEGAREGAGRGREGVDGVEDERAADGVEGVRDVDGEDPLAAGARGAGGRVGELGAVARDAELPRVGEEAVEVGYAAVVCELHSKLAGCVFLGFSNQTNDDDVFGSQCCGCVSHTWSSLIAVVRLGLMTV